MITCQYENMALQAINEASSDLIADMTMILNLAPYSSQLIVVAPLHMCDLESIRPTQRRR